MLEEVLNNKESIKTVKDLMWDICLKIDDEFDEIISKIKTGNYSNSEICDLLKSLKEEIY